MACGDLPIFLGKRIVVINAATVCSQPESPVAVGNDGVDEATDVLIAEVAGGEVVLVEPRAGIDNAEACRGTHCHLSADRRQTFRFPYGQIVSLAIDNAGQRTVDSPNPQMSKVVTSQTGNILCRQIS